jgi:hypothetical protein
MPKHRSSVYTVVREEQVTVPHEYEGYRFSAIIGTYTTHMRAEEVVGASAQVLLDAGAEPDEYRFSVMASTFYDE